MTWQVWAAIGLTFAIAIVYGWFHGHKGGGKQEASE